MAFLIFISCKELNEKNALPSLVELTVVDSVLIKENNFFLNGQFHVHLVGDSLIGVSSYKSPSVGFYHISGNQRKRIASGDYPVGSFLPSYFDASEYPIVYVLDKRSESVLIFDVDEQKLIKKIKLELPFGKEIKIIGSKFKKLPEGFLLELASSEFDNLDSKYFKESGKLIYYFDELGQIRDGSFLEYPIEIKNVNGSLRAIDYLQFCSFEEEIYFVFPHERKIKYFDAKNFGQLIEEIPLPESRYFNFQLIGAEKIYSIEEMDKSRTPNRMDIPQNHYFNSIFAKKDFLFVQTWMNTKIEKERSQTFSHLLIYDKPNKKWLETANPLNILDIGMLAGVVNDTLYFYEGSLMKHDEKYVKRAVLRPIKE
ncbi:MAG: hypothetical protein LPJ98_01640 [Cyclobacteriaceae bacterium]|nr:hypothetical protein [Cyclobacteriaceae bacterium]